MPEVYTEEAKVLHSKQLGHKGEKNPAANYSETEILEARKFYVNHTMEETFTKYGYNSKSLDGFRRSIVQNYTNIPIYSKQKKKWFLKNKEINIKDYNPVSTISVSGE